MSLGWREQRPLRPIDQLSNTFKTCSGDPAPPQAGSPAWPTAPGSGKSVKHIRNVF